MRLSGVGVNTKYICLSVCYFLYSKVILKDKANTAAKKKKDVPAVPQMLFLYIGCAHYAFPHCALLK